MLNQIKLWTYAARPKTLFVGIAPIIIGTAMALPVFDLPTFLWILFGTLAIQIGTNYCNDYFDFLKGADTIHRKGPKKLLQQKLLTPKSMKIAFISCFICAALCSYILAQRGGIMLLAVGAICIIFSILYTSPPFPLAYLGLGDLFVLIFYGPVATLFCYYLQTLHFSYTVLIASLAPGLLGVSILTINNLRDYTEDKAAHKHTLVVRFGITYGKIHYLTSLVLCSLIPPALVLYTHAHLVSLIASLSLLLALPAIKTVFNYTDPNELNPVFIQTARIIPLYTFLFSLGWLL